MPQILKAHTGNFFEIEFSCKSSVFTLGVFVVLITTGLTFSLLNGRSWLFEYYSEFFAVIAQLCASRLSGVQINHTSGEDPWDDSLEGQLESASQLTQCWTECVWVSFYTNLRPEAVWLFKHGMKPCVVNPTWPELMLCKPFCVFWGISVAYQCIDTQLCSMNLGLAQTLPPTRWLCLCQSFLFWTVGKVV